MVVLVGLGVGSSWDGVSCGEALGVGLSWGWVLSVSGWLLDDPPATNLFARRLFVILHSYFLLRPAYRNSNYGTQLGLPIALSGFDDVSFLFGSLSRRQVYFFNDNHFNLLT